MPSVTFEGHTLHIDGEPALIQAGTLHYFRLPHPSLWRPVLERMRMAGFNAVTVPFPWAYHSPAAGLYDFTGPRDVRQLLDAVEAAGLWLIVQLGPWIRADLDTGGVPMWAWQQPDFVPRCGSDVSAGPAFTFLRAVREWWERLFPYFVARSNLILALLDAGPCAEDVALMRYGAPLTALARTLGVTVPCVTADLPPAGKPGAAAQWLRVLPDVLDALGVDGAAPLALVEVVIGQPVMWGQPRARTTSARRGEHPRAVQADLQGQGMLCASLAPVHQGVSWGYWGQAQHGAAYSGGAVVGAGATLPTSYFNARALALTTETLGTLLVKAQPADMVYASESRYLRAARRSDAATVVFLNAVDVGRGETRISTALGGEMLTTEPVRLAADAVRILPQNWRIAGGMLLMTTLEPVLRLTIAGRHLLILCNAAGGDVLLSDDFRPRHTRGPVRARRTEAGLAVRFEAGRVVSLLLDGPEGAVQILALAPQLAARVWPLDDAWHTTPTFAAQWQPAPEEPARGLIIGPEYVRPRGDGTYSYLVGGKGFGYRWGPWRGSDPHTWLAPLTWRAPRAVTPPALTWAVPRSGAPEVAPDYDDAGWHYIAPGLEQSARAPLAMTAHGIATGFAWYRGRFKGAATALTLRCPHACDVFFNGTQIASINPPSDATLRDVPKIFPLPAHLLREENVLAILVEGLGNVTTWNAVNPPRGLLTCTLDNGLPILWRMRGGLGGERSIQGFPGYASWTLVPDAGAPDITWHCASFEWALPEAVECPLYVFVDRTPTKAYIFLNGQLVGRYWEGYSPQHRFWLPEGILQRRGINEILIAQWTRGAPVGLGDVYLETGPVLAWRE